VRSSCLTRSHPARHYRYHILDLRLIRKSPPFHTLLCTSQRWRIRSKRLRVLSRDCVWRLHQMSKRLLWKSRFGYCYTANIEHSHGSTRYFMDYASFNHPICCVPSHPNSREEILGIFQWYRILSPCLTTKVNSVGMYSRILLTTNEVISDRFVW